MAMLLGRRLSSISSHPRTELFLTLRDQKRRLSAKVVAVVPIDLVSHRSGSRSTCVDGLIVLISSARRNPRSVYSHLFQTLVTLENIEREETG